MTDYDAFEEWAVDNGYQANNSDWEVWLAATKWKDTQMSKLGSLYIKVGEPEGPLCGGGCEVDDWAASEIERLRKALLDIASSGKTKTGMKEFARNTLGLVPNA